MQIRISVMLIVGMLLAFNLVQTCEALSLKSGSSPRLLHRNGDHHSELKYEELKLFLHRAEECRSNPDSCADSIDQVVDNSNKTQEHIIDEVNKTEAEFDNFTREFQSCKTTETQSANDKSGTFTKMNDDHTVCRKAEELEKEASDTCQELLKSKQTVVDTKCESKTLTTPVNDLVQVCEPSAEEPLGTWLQGMSSTFKKRYEAWVAADNECEEAKESLANSTRDCDVKKEEFTNQTQKCDQQLGNLEAYACSWATSITTDCSAYETCYASVLTRYNAAASALPALEARWNDTWQSAERMKCLAAAVDSKGVVNQDKMETCDEVANTTYLTVNVTSASAKASCAQPVIYPGSAKFKELVYSGLPPGLPVREPTLCLTWKKQPCAAHSSFDGSIVSLQTLTGNCGVEYNGHVICGPSTMVYPGKFMFTHDGTDCTGKGTLTFKHYSKWVPCRYDPSGNPAYPSANSPHLTCSDSIVQGASPAEATFNFNPMSNGRSGNVRLTFAGTTTKPLSRKENFNSATTLYARDFEIATTGVAWGFFPQNIENTHDRTFQLLGTLSTVGVFGSGNAGAIYRKYEGTASTFPSECESGYAVFRLDSTYDAQQTPNRRTFTVWCKSIPTGYTFNDRVWSPYPPIGSTAPLTCPDGSVITGIRAFNSDQGVKNIQRTGYSIQCLALSLDPPLQQSFKVEFIST